MRMSDHGRNLLARWEGGAQPSVYKDSGGAPTIGIGHLLTRFERSSGQIRIADRLVNYSRGLVLPEMQTLFAQDLLPVQEAVTDDVTVALAECQFDALCSFVYNIGVQAFEDVDRATPGDQPCMLLRLLNGGQYSAVPNQLMRWVYDNHVRVQGLVNRRENEVALWEGRV